MDIAPGRRGARLLLARPELLREQARALARASVHGPVHVLYPMIVDADQFLELRALFDQTVADLQTGGLQHGALFEIPSACFTARRILDVTDFGCIGTNDLIQYSLAIDRGNREVAHLYNPLHPAIIRMIKHVADVAKDHGIKVFMCGEMAGDPIPIPVLLGLGMDELSMNPQSIPAVKQMIRSLSVKDSRQCAKEVLKKKTSKDIMDLLQDRYGSIISKKAYNQ